MAVNDSEQQHDHRFWAMLNEAARHEQDWRQGAERNLRYYDGDQWTDEEIAILEERGQQATVINLCRPTIDTMHSIYNDRKTDEQCVGREPSDDELAGVCTHLLKQTKDESNYPYLESQWFRSGALTGIGWMEIKAGERMYGNGDRQKVIDIVQVPFEEIYFDPFFRKMDGSDMRYVIRRVWMDVDQVRDMWPEKADEIQTVIIAFNDDSVELQEKYAQGLAGGQNGFSRLTHYNHETNRIAVQECWYYDSARKLHHCIFCHNTFLEGGLEDSMNEDPHGLNLIPFVPFIGNRDRKGLPQGVLDWIVGMQDSINKSFSKWQWNMSARQLMYEDGTIDDIEEVRDELAKPDGVMRFEAGALASGRVQIPKNIEESQHLTNMMGLMTQYVQRVSGINDALMGIGGTNARSAQQEASRQIQGSQMQTAIIENMFAAKRRLSWMILMFIGKYYDDERMVRTVGPSGNPEYYQINKPYIAEDGTERVLTMEEALRFDVVLRPVQAFNTVRQNTLSTVAEMAKAGAIPPPVASEIAIDLIDIPFKQELKARVQQYFEQQQALELASQQANTGG